MTTLSEVEDHRSAVLSLATLAIRDLVQLWRSLDLDTPREVAEALREAMPELFAAYGLAAGTLGADFYDEMRAGAAVAGAYLATAAEVPGNDSAQALVGWGLAPLFQHDAGEPESDVDAALSRLSAGLQRAVAGTDRQTIITNTRRDPSAVRYVRHASANACAFCAVLATRQAVYRTEAVKFHTSCHCVAVPVWPGDELEEPPYVADWREAYYDARERVSDPNDLKALLAVMRESTGLR